MVVRDTAKAAVDLMQLPVELNNARRVASVMVAGKSDFSFIPEWERAIVGDKNPIRADAVEFARLAVQRYATHCEIQPYATSVDEIGDHIAQNPHNEVGVVAVLKCDWFNDSPVIGITHFRRTWANNIILDYLATHPSIVRPPSPHYAHKVRGVGKALLYFICKLAARYGCKYIWGEATQISNEFYQKVFTLDPVTDLIYVPQKNFTEYVDRLDKEWTDSASSVTTVPNSSLERGYELEADHPPFVGSSTAVFNPPRILASHFLDLPAHVQIEIANSLGLLCSNDDLQQPNEELFPRIFQRAIDKGKLSNLWSEVERRHPGGTRGTNPFAPR